jgi:biopolymer transport protein TolQ
MGEEHNILSMMLGSGPVVLGVLIILIGLSVFSWAITIAKFLQLKKAREDSEEFSELFWETKNFARVDDSSRRLASSPLVKLFISGYRETMRLLQERGETQISTTTDTELESISSAMKRAGVEENVRLEKGITFLATVASAAPFIGLFGTVWGIMDAFHGLSSAKSTTIQAVAPGISEALIATAIGLAAAIPAAVAYNYFSATLRQFRESMDTFCDEFISVAKRTVTGAVRAK